MALATTWTPFSQSIRSVRPDQFRSSYPPVSHRSFRFRGSLAERTPSMDGVLKRLPARFRHPVPNEIGEAIKTTIEADLSAASREERHRKGLAGFRRLGRYSSPKPDTTAKLLTPLVRVSYFLLRLLAEIRLRKLPIRCGTPTASDAVLSAISSRQRLVRSHSAMSQGGHLVKPTGSGKTWATGNVPRY